MTGQASAVWVSTQQVRNFVIIIVYVDAVWDVLPPESASGAQSSKYILAIFYVGILITLAFSGLPTKDVPYLQFGFRHMGQLLACYN